MSKQGCKKFPGGGRELQCGCIEKILIQFKFELLTQLQLLEWERSCSSGGGGGGGGGGKKSKWASAFHTDYRSYGSPGLRPLSFSVHFPPTPPPPPPSPNPSLKKIVFVLYIMLLVIMRKLHTTRDVSSYGTCNTLLNRTF